MASGFCEIRAGIEVKHLETAADGRILRAVYAEAGKPGVLKAIEADQFILAAGAIETPRLLLNSEVARASGQVGRNFMETLAWTSIGLHPDPIGSHRGHPSDGICWDYNDPDALDGIVGGFRLSPGTAEANLVGPINYAARVVGGWGDSHRQQMKDKFGRALGLSSFGENVPNTRSFIDIEQDAKDLNGYAKARIHSHLPESELDRLRIMRGTIRGILDAAGVDEIVEESGTYDEFGASHVFGTCRMGTSGEPAVTDDLGRVFGHPNLTLADASLFPSSGGGESPSLTIAALAIRAIYRLF